MIRIFLLTIFSIIYLNAGQHYLLLDLDLEDEKIGNEDYISQEIIYQYYPLGMGFYGSFAFGNTQLKVENGFDIHDDIEYNYLKMGIGLSFIEVYGVAPFQSDIPDQYNVDEIENYHGIAIELLNMKIGNFYLSVVAGREYQKELEYATNQFHDISGDYLSYRIGYTFGDVKHGYLGGAIPLAIVGAIGIYENTLGTEGLGIPLDDFLRYNN